MKRLIDERSLPANWAGNRYAIRTEDLETLIANQPFRFRSPPRDRIPLRYELRVANCPAVPALLSRYARAVEAHSLEGLSLLLDAKWPGRELRRDIATAFENVVERCPDVDKGLLAGAHMANAIEELGGPIPARPSNIEV